MDQSAEYGDRMGSVHAMRGDGSALRQGGVAGEWDPGWIDEWGCGVSQSPDGRAI